MFYVHLQILMKILNFLSKKFPMKNFKKIAKLFTDDLEKKIAHVAVNFCGVVRSQFSIKIVEKFCWKIRIENLFQIDENMQKFSSILRFRKKVVPENWFHPRHFIEIIILFFKNVFSEFLEKRISIDS